MWVTQSLHVVTANLCPLAIPALPLSSQPALSSPAPSFLKQSKPGHTQLFVPRHGWGMNSRFVPSWTKPFVQEQLWAAGGEYGVGVGAKQTQPHSPRLVNRQQLHAGGRQSSGWNPWPGGCSRGKRLLLWWAVPRGFTAKCLCPWPQAHPQLPVSPAPLLCPHPAVWDEKTPLFGVFAIMMKAFFSF